MKTHIFNKSTKNGNGTKKTKNNFTQITLVLALILLMFGNVSWGQTATYTISSKTAVTTSGTAPSGSSATYAQTYTTQGQMTSSNSTTLTLSGYAGFKITSIVLSMKSNSGSGAGSLNVVAGSTTISSVATSAFNTANWNGSYTTSYTNITKTPTAYAIQTGENIVITILASVNSLYIQSYSITYEPVSATPTITPSPSSLSGFSYTQGSGPSATQTFTISGANLTSSGNITISGSTNYEVSTDGTTFGATALFPFASGVITGQPKTVYVRLKAGLTAATYNENITYSGGGVSSTNFACNGSVSAIVAKKILFDASSGQSLASADWIVDADTWNAGWYSSGVCHTSGTESNAQRYPTPASPTSESDWSGGNSRWAYELYLLGYAIESLGPCQDITYGNASNPQDLSNYSVFICNEPNVQFTAAEKTAILAFVNAGGGLYMGADHGYAGGTTCTAPNDEADRNCDGWNSTEIWNDLMSTNPFGIQFNHDNTASPSTSVELTGDPIVTGTAGTVSNISFNDGATMTVNTCANATAHGAIFMTGTTLPSSTNIMVASASYGAGRVVGVGDSSPTGDGTGDTNGETRYNNIAEVNNQTMLINATVWLAEGNARLVVGSSCLTGFTYAQGAGPSTNQTFTLNGYGFSGTGNITVTPSTNYEVSTDGTTWGGSTITYPYASGVITGQPKTVYVRLKAGLTSGSSPYNNELVSISGGSATTINVTCSGTVTPAATPTITATPATLSGFTYVVGAGPSTEQSFVMSGANTDGTNVTVTPPANYEISNTSGSGFTTGALTFLAYNGSNKTIYVRLASDLTANTYSGNITIAGGGDADGTSVALSGSVTTSGSSNVFISEFAGAGYLNDFNDEYIELTNNGSASQDLTGWSLLYYNATTLEATINLTGSIAQNSAYLIAVRSTAGTINGVTPNLAGAFASMNSTGYVVLKNASSTIVDQAGGSADKFSDSKNYEFTNCVGDNLPTTNWTDLGTGNGTPGVINCIIPCTAPDAPTTTGGSVCNSGTVNLSASGAVAGEVYKWYAASTGGTALKTSADNTDNTYTTASISTSTNYYVTRYITATSCESTPRTVVAATVVSSATSIAPTTTQNIVVSTNGSLLTVTEGSVATSRVWKYGTSSGSYPTSTGTTTTTFTPNFGSAGTYYVVCESTYPAPCGVVTSNEVVINVATNSITTSAISGSPFCAGASVSVPYTIGGTYTAGNVFTAQLSNSTGSFATPTDIGTTTSTAAGTISATIPAGTATGTGYRIRVVSSTPAFIGSDNGSNLTINAMVTPSVTIAITTGANPSCAGASVKFTPTPTNGGTTPTYQWKVNGSNATTGSTYTTTTLANNDIVSCVMTSTATCPSVATATSNGITMTINAVPATPTASSNSPICAGSTLNLTSNATGTISWTGPNSFTSAIQNPSIASATAAATGTYNVTSTVNGCTSLAGTTSVTVTAPAITGTTAVTIGGTTTLTGTPAGGTWSSATPAVATINATTGVVNGITDGTSLITYTVSGCSATTTVTATTGPCLSEGFAGGTTAPSGWTFTGLTTTYTSAAYYGAASPSIKLENTGQRIETPTFTNASELSFYCFVQSGFTSSLLIEGWDGSSWLTIDNNTSLPQSDATALVTYNSSTTPALAPGFTKFRFTFTKSSGNVAFDDINVICSTTPYPEMGITGNGQAIVDNDATPTVADWTDFGSTVTTGGTIDRTFTIQNLGNGTLNLTGTPIVTTTGNFTVTSQPSSTIAAGGTATFTVRFDPAADGLATGTISIANNDSNENPYNFSVKGTGTATPTIWLIDEKFDNVTSIATINLTNTPGFTATQTGTGTITYSTSAAKYNRSANSITTLGPTGSTVTITTPTFSNGDLLSFWYRQSSSASTNGLLVEQYIPAKAGWTTLASIPGSLETGKPKVYFYPIANTVTQIRFTIDRSSNLYQGYLDDVRIRQAGACTSDLKILQTLIYSCSGSEGINESVIFKTGATPVKIDDISVSFPNVGSGGTEYSMESDQKFTTNPAYIAQLNALVQLSYPACSPILEPPVGEIPANSYAIIFTGSSPSVVYDFKAACESGTNYYAFFCDNVNTQGRYGNSVFSGEKCFTSLIDKSSGCYDSQFYDEGLPGNAGDLAAYDETTRALSYKNFGCEVALSPLPIELASFTANCNNGNTEIEWVTASETNNNYFTLERSSDLSKWTEIARVNGAGNSNTPLTYTYSDDSHISNVMYYRLKQTDYDGRFETFNPISASCDQGMNNSINLYPNPATDQLSCDLYNGIGTKAKIEMVNAYGQLVLSEEYTLEEGFNHLVFDISKFQSGSYYFKLVTPDGQIVKVKTFVKL